MELYEKNILFLKEYLNTIYQEIMKEQSRYYSKIEYVEEKQNLLVEHQEKKCFIHSTYDTNREVNMMFKNIDKDTKNLMIFGIGCGYAVDYIKENFKKLEKVVIIEPDLNVFLSLLNIIDIQDMLVKLKNVTFIVNKTEVDAVNIFWDRVSGSIKDGVAIVYNISYRTLYSGYFEALIERWSKYLKDTLVNIATNDYFLYTWPVNIFKNIKSEALPIHELIGKFDDLPVIIVSAGPSLNKNMHYLKDIRNKAVIIAVGSAIKVLDSNDIIPHFRFAFDGSKEENNIFKNIDTKSSPLVFSDELYNEILPAYKGKKIRMVLNTDYLLQYIQKNTQNSTFTISSGFSIANVALDAVIKLGFKKIIFMGQDLCYTEGSIHAKGSWNNKELDFSKENYIKTKNVFGDLVYTDKQFLGMKTMLENMIKAYPNIEFINATEGGLHIEGTTDRVFEDVTKKYFLKSCDIESIINTIYNKYNSLDYSDKMNKIISEINLDIENMLIINNERIKKLKKIHRYIQRKMGVNKLIGELKYVKKFEDLLENIYFYKEGVKPMLSSKFDSISANYYYNGCDKNEQLHSMESIELGKSVELEKYLKLIKSLIE